MYDSFTIANFFIAKSFDTGVKLCPQKLIKLVYIAHGWSLALYAKPLLGEAITKGKFGPIINSLYQYFAPQYGVRQITTLHMRENFYPYVKDEKTLALLNRIWEVYGHFTDLEVASLTCKPNSPWDLANRANLHIVSNDMIKDYYVSLIKRPINFKNNEIQ